MKRDVVSKDGMPCELVSRASSVHILRFRHGSPNGVAVHRGIVVVWDKDYDDRVIDWINSLHDDDAKLIEWAGADKGILMLGVVSGIDVDDLADVLAPSGTVEVCGQHWVLQWYDANTGKPLGDA